MKGYKVVNYQKWSSIPDIFPNIKKAKQAKEEWKYCEGAVIEYFNSKSNKAKTIWK